jgi:sugar/nucleoside kinase (ribokinase family)
MSAVAADVVVAGHICLDIIPTFREHTGKLADLLQPGSLAEIGPAVLSTGGAVSNTGLALHRLGVRTRLMGKIGDDLFGQAVRRVLHAHHPRLAEGLLVSPDQPTSYTLVLSPPGVDRVFLHCPGANDAFGADDVPYSELVGVRLFHFGYPPIMRRFYADGGVELETMFRRVRRQGVATSLDMAKPDDAGEAGLVDWRTVLKRVLPHVDIFLPSLEETLFMLDRQRLDRLSADGNLLAHIDGELLTEVAEELLNMGAGVVGLKLGNQGLYLRTARDRSRLALLSRAVNHPLEGWLGRELLTPCFEVNVVGTTGCGDCTIAGFLAGLLHGLPVEQAMTAAVAVGACNVERADATSGVPTWSALQARIAAGWKKRPWPADWPGWHPAAARGISCGPCDRP